MGWGKGKNARQKGKEGEKSEQQLGLTQNPFVISQRTIIDGSSALYPLNKAPGKSPRLKVASGKVRKVRSVYRHPYFEIGETRLYALWSLEFLCFGLHSVKLTNIPSIPRNGRKLLFKPRILSKRRQCRNYALEAFCPTQNIVERDRFLRRIERAVRLQNVILFDSEAIMVGVERIST